MAVVVAVAVAGVGVAVGGGVGVGIGVKVSTYRTKKTSVVHSHPPSHYIRTHTHVLEAVSVA